MNSQLKYTSIDFKANIYPYKLENSKRNVGFFTISVNIFTVNTKKKKKIVCMDFRNLYGDSRQQLMVKPWPKQSVYKTK